MVVLIDLGVFAKNASLARIVAEQCKVPRDESLEFWLDQEQDYLQACRGASSESEFFDDMAYKWSVKNLEHQMAPGELTDAYRAWVRQPTSGVPEVLLGIESHPTNPDGTGLVEDGAPEIYLVADELVDTADLVYDWFPDVVAMLSGEFWSFEIGAVKTEPGFFQHVISELGGDPHDLLFISKSSRSLEAARDAGIATIRFANAAQLWTVLSDSYGFTFYDDDAVSWRARLNDAALDDVMRDVF